MGIGEVIGKNVRNKYTVNKSHGQIYITGRRNFGFGLIFRNFWPQNQLKLLPCLKENSSEDLYYLLRNIPADAETFELLAKFCRGYAVQMSTENIASDNPRHIGEPIIISTNYADDEDDDDSYRPNARRRLFALDWQEDLTTLPFQLYEPIVNRMNQHEIPPRSAFRNGFKIRIGKQLDQEVKDLLLPSQGYAKKAQYDTECIRRILKVFYGNYKSSDASGLITVAELTEEILA
ncbi:hypothetical protein REPUB_Repub06bG0080800 [Reevesia pubescens]